MSDMLPDFANANICLYEALSNLHAKSWLIWAYNNLKPLFIEEKKKHQKSTINTIKQGKSWTSNGASSSGGSRERYGNVFKLKGQGRAPTGSGV